MNYVMTFFAGVFVTFLLLVVIVDEPPYVVEVKSNEGDGYGLVVRDTTFLRSNQHTHQIKVECVDRFTKGDNISDEELEECKA